jgi:hypothetical protein
LAWRLLLTVNRDSRREDANMMIIDSTAQLSWLMMGMNVLLAVAGAAILASVLQRRVTSSTSAVSTKKLAVVGSSSSAPAPAEDAPSDTSVPEAA